MGGIPIAETPKLSEAEVNARLIEIGKNAVVGDPHTVWVVEDANFASKPYPSRTNLDNVMYAVAVELLDRFPTYRLIRDSITFYKYCHQEAAQQDAIARLTKAGKNIT